MRDVVDCILEILRTGTQWRNMKHPRLRWQIVYYYFRRRGFDGTLERLNSELNKIERKRQGKQETPSQGFVPVGWRWVSERTFGWLNRTGDPVLSEALKRL